MATFKVDQVQKSTTPLEIVADLGKLLKTRMGGTTPESHFKPDQDEWPVVATYGLSNAFVSAVHTAYSKHYPLVFSPDHIWMCIAQGLSQHVNADPEKLRKRFVEHEGKEELIVQRDDFVKGSPDNPWPEVFDEFSKQIREHVGEKTHDLLTPDFTTTGPNDRAAAQVVLMDTFKEYFEYTVHTLCGIPEVTLEGTVEDWKKLRERAIGLAQYDLDWWINALKPILDQFVNAASGKVDQKFWSAIYKQSNSSGGPYINGWIITLFPYCSRPGLRPGSESTFRNPYLEDWDDESKNTMSFYGMTTDMFPRGIVSTPFKWVYFGKEIPMHFYAGFMAVSQDPNSLSVRPVVGWAVVDDEEEESNRISDSILSWRVHMESKNCTGGLKPT